MDLIFEYYLYINDISKIIPNILQSCSKPFTYAVGLNELGADEVHGYVGQEPSGRMFNELTLDFNSKYSMFMILNIEIRSVVIYKTKLLF